MTYDFTAINNIKIEAGLLNSEALSTLDMGSGAALLYPEDMPECWVESVSSRINPLVSVRLPPRDACKTLSIYSHVVETLAAAGIQRSGAVIGLGGGAVTDLAGFVAATYLRGVRFYAFPTTLLGMVDAAIGGKTALNLAAGKNLLGTFSPATAVWCDPKALDTLPRPVLREGAAEAYKHGLIARPDLLDPILRGELENANTRTSLIQAAMSVKLSIVERDPTEQGERAFLNFGHTLAHALEAHTDGQLPHGEAVAYGMHWAAHLSKRLGKTDPTKTDLTMYTRAFLEWQQPTMLHGLCFDQLLDFMKKDKKNSGLSGIRFVLLEKLGRPYLQAIEKDLLEREWLLYREELIEIGLYSE